MFYTDEAKTRAINTKKIVYISKGEFKSTYEHTKHFYNYIYTAHKDYFSWEYDTEKERDDEFDKLIEILNLKLKNYKNSINEIKL
jgi:hypothetical protein